MRTSSDKKPKPRNNATSKKDKGKPKRTEGAPRTKKDTEKLLEERASNKGKRGSSREVKQERPDKRKPLDKKFADKKSFGDKPSDKKYGDKKPYGESSFAKKFGPKKTYGDKPYAAKSGAGKDFGDRKPFRRKLLNAPPISAESRQAKLDGFVRLNKFLSNAGVASRRDADKLIELGLVKVNGVVVTELGHKVNPKTDVVQHDDRVLKPEKLRYVLLNKPKDYITTLDDPEERKTVMELIRSACVERIYPVGRLDRMTTGLLLFTNDGEMAKRLTHPRYGIQKLYHIELVQKVKGTDLDAIREGIKLEDGFIQADEVSFVDEDQHQVGIRLHSGRNRIVRRIFEHMNYTVKKLDRVMFAGLTKKDLPRGRFRHLTDQELNFLKMIR